MTPGELAAIAREITRVRGASIQSVHQDGKTRFRLVLEERRRRQDLVLDLDPRFPRVHLAPHVPAPLQPTPLAARIRRRLMGGRIEGAYAIKGERALAIAIGRGRRTWSLWFEGFGRGANLYVVDPEGRVVATPRGHIARQRGSSVGDVFHAAKPPEHGDDTQDAVRPGTSARVREAAQKADEERKHAERAVELGRTLKRERARAHRAVRRLEKMLERGVDAERLEHEARLLQANFHLLTPDLETVILEDHEAEPPREIPIRLDPGQAPGEQIAHRFRRARKAKRGIEEANQRLPGARARLTGLDELLAAEDLAPEALADGLQALGIRPPGRQPPRRGKPERAEPWMTYRSADGWPILVGRHAKGNDLLTGRKARPQDLFLHVRGASGSHVIVPTPSGKTVPLPTLLDAAELAAWFSGRRHAPVVEIDHVERRHVRRPRGAKPGTVVLSQSHTLRLETDAARRGRVLGSRSK